ncbi:secondary thiamine-phosphate synthase enzyme YjbQ [Azotosporobacter soli]|uniref:secondary thiamine-phosphate synthase enzyme YjbQ n=1 Tax=Azotosporobacter soli TaxID=3055040 RepID=UPI0031FF34CA
MREIKLSTPREGFIDITKQVEKAVLEAGTRKGLCQVFVPHTTAAVTINENADPDVVTDMLTALNAMVPKLAYRHREGNSRAHLKSSLLGASVSLPILEGRLALGTWQGIYFCEFDGPRDRKFCIQIVGD